MFAPVLGLIMTTAMLTTSTRHDTGHENSVNPVLSVNAIVHLDTNTSIDVSMFLVGLCCGSGGAFRAAAEVAA